MSDYNVQRQEALKHACRMIETTEYAPWDIAMQHDSTSAGRVTQHCFDSVRALSKALLDALWELREGKVLSDICDTQILPGYQRPDFPDTPAGGRASAWEDVAVLVTSVNTKPFISFVTGDVYKDVDNFLNGNLHNWLLQSQKQWRVAGAGVRSSILDGQMPKKEPEKATLKTMFLVLRECFATGPARPSPLVNQAADKFAAQFSVKGWPLHVHAPNVAADKDSCFLREVSLQFQEWHLSCGITQSGNAHTPEREAAKDVFSDLREEFHKRSRPCGKNPAAPCPGTCVQDSFDAIPDGDYKQKCRIAVDTIIARLK